MKKFALRRRKYENAKLKFLRKSLTMAVKFRFNVPLQKPSIGTSFSIGPPFDNLTFTLLSYEISSLCPETARCISAGVAIVKLSINGVSVELRNDDASNNVVREIKSKSGNYLLQGNHVHWTGPKTARYPELPVEIQLEEPGTVVKLEVGQPYIITHGANITTGSSWDYSIPDGMKLIYKGLHNSCQPGLSGCGGRESIVLVPERKGRFVYRATYGQQWDKNISKSEEVITFIVE